MSDLVGNSEDRFSHNAAQTVNRVNSAFPGGGDLKDTDSKVPKRGSVLIGLITPDGAIWPRYQRAVLIR